MKIYSVLCAVLVVVHLSLVESEPILLESFVRTEEGANWGRWSNCQPNKYVNAVNLKIDPDYSSTHSGLSGLKMYCAAPGEPSSLAYITSSIGSHGDYTGHQYCPKAGFVTGFRLKSDLEGKRGSSNIRFFCNTGGNGLTFQPNVNESWGNWTERIDCPEDQAICGIQTQVVDLRREAYRLRARGGSPNPNITNSEASGLHNLKIACCEIKVNCEANPTKEIIFDYDNRKGTTDIDESYSASSGYSFQTWESGSESTVTRTTHVAGIGIGAILKFINSRIGYRFQKDFENLSRYSYATLTVETKSESFSRNLTVPAGVRVQILQPVVHCHELVVKNKFWERVDTNATEENKIITLETEMSNLKTQYQECLMKFNETVRAGGEMHDILNTVIDVWG